MRVVAAMLRGWRTARVAVNLCQVFGHASGDLAENFVAQQLAAQGYQLHYWTRDNRAELDFVVERQGCLSAIEVKAGENTRSRSLAGFKGASGIDRLVRVSAKPFGAAGGMLSVPLYAAFCL